MLSRLKPNEAYDLDPITSSDGSVPTLALLFKSKQSLVSELVNVEFYSSDGSQVSSYSPTVEGQGTQNGVLISLMEIPRRATCFKVVDRNSSRRKCGVFRFSDVDNDRNSLVGRVIRVGLRKYENYGFGFESVAIQLWLGSPADAVQILFTHLGGQPDKPLPFTFSTYDNHGDQLIPVGSLPVNSEHGPLLTMKGSGARVAETTARLEVPKGGRLIALQGLKWQGAESARIIAAPKLVARSASVESIRPFLESMDLSDRLVCIDSQSSSVPGDLASQRQKELVEHLIAGGWKVIHLSSDHDEWSGQVGDQNLLEVRRVDQDALIAALGEFKETGTRVWLSAGNVTPNALAATNYLKLCGWKIAYEYTESRKPSFYERKIEDFSPFIEGKILRDADLVLASTDELAAKVEWEYNMPRNSVIVASPALRNESFGTNSKRSRVATSVALEEIA